MAQPRLSSAKQKHSFNEINNHPPNPSRVLQSKTLRLQQHKNVNPRLPENF
ncbi:hypothetical protein EIKCOROL_00720 [Eikenella corrodens ATCC 23834]|uniref:Uncharacterized protein n=1 Tax=Eikenella corrodens ATCC 23834 TaxID=546274 RepID=C0DTP0_EIKCO|nr:hypothetical protein EIKCOROL_00720 [Eikenella corrodens ATCC 23834]